MQITKSILRFYKRNDLWANLIVLFMIVIIIKCIMNKFKKQREAFSQNNSYVIKRDLEVFDDFYTNYYDELAFSNKKNIFELGEIITLTDMSTRSKVLDIGSGTGHHVAMLNEYDIPVIGMDNSRSMINYAKKTYPNSNFKLGNALDKSIYPANSFTHTLCLYYTIYYIQDKKQFLKTV